MIVVSESHQGTELYRESLGELGKEGVWGSYFRRVGKGSCCRANAPVSRPHAHLHAGGIGGRNILGLSVGRGAKKAGLNRGRSCTANQQQQRKAQAKPTVNSEAGNFFTQCSSNRGRGPVPQAWKRCYDFGQGSSVYPRAIARQGLSWELWATNAPSGRMRDGRRGSRQGLRMHLKASTCLNFAPHGTALPHLVPALRWGIGCRIWVTAPSREGDVGLKNKMKSGQRARVRGDPRQRHSKGRAPGRALQGPSFLRGALMGRR